MNDKSLKLDLKQIRKAAKEIRDSSNVARNMVVTQEGATKISWFNSNNKYEETKKKAEKLIYKHINADHLEELLESVDINRPKVIAFESAYSMDGLISPIKRICELAKKYNVSATCIDNILNDTYGHIKKNSFDIFFSNII